MSNPVRTAAEDTLATRHLRVGWWLVLVFLVLGLVLEALHALKVGAYLGVKSETRRLMWTLAHAHGTLLGVLHLAYAFTLTRVPEWTGSSRRVASVSLLGASLLLPGGFFLGGVGVTAGDPGVGVMLVPLGGVLLLVGVFMTARAVAGSGPAAGSGQQKR